MRPRPFPVSLVTPLLYWLYCCTRFCSALKLSLTQMLQNTTLILIMMEKQQSCIWQDHRTGLDFPNDCLGNKKWLAGLQKKFAAFFFPLCVSRAQNITRTKVFQPFTHGSPHLFPISGLLESIQNYYGQAS